MNSLLNIEQRNKRRLIKIHKLKQENRMLASKRKAKLDHFNRSHTTTILDVDVRLLHSKTHDSFISSINKFQIEYWNVDTFYFIDIYFL